MSFYCHDLLAFMTPILSYTLALVIVLFSLEIDKFFIFPDCGIPFALSFKRSFSADVKQFPSFADPDIEAAFKDLMAMSWDEIPDSVLGSTKKALSKNTDDKAGQEALANVFRAAEASVEFGAVLVSLRMALDDLCGLTGEVSLLLCRL